MLRTLLCLMSVFFIQTGYSQVEMADDFRGEGKIYVVIAIILLILAGFFTLLFRLDNKTKKLYKEIKEK